MLFGRLCPGSGILPEALANDAIDQTCNLLRYHYWADWSTRLAPYPEAAKWHEP